MSYESPYGATGRNWFWRAWPNESTYDFDGTRIGSSDFKTKRQAAEFAARNGGGSICKMRFCGAHSGSTETRMDSLEIQASHVYGRRVR
jgi:hypothetical protein